MDTVLPLSQSGVILPFRAVFPQINHYQSDQETSDRFVIMATGPVIPAHSLQTCGLSDFKKNNKNEIILH